MILWTTLPTEKTPKEWRPRAGRLWRWMVDTDPWRITLSRQYLDLAADDWRFGYNYYTLGVSREWLFGLEHDYYDGPHHTLHLGPVWVAWAPNYWCHTCSPPHQHDTNGAVAAFVEAVLAAAMEAA